MITRVTCRDFPESFACAGSHREDGRLMLCGDAPSFEVHYVAGYTLYLCGTCKDAAVLEALAAA